VLERVGSSDRRWVFVQLMPLGMWGGDPDHRPPVPAFDLVERRVLESHRIARVDEPHRVLFVRRVR